MREYTVEQNGELQRDRLVHVARKHVGKRYRYGARQSEIPRAFDCSSFVQYLYRRIGIELPRTSLEQAHCGRRVPVRLRSGHPEPRRRVRRPLQRNLAVGDLLFFTGSQGRYDPTFPDGIGHVAMVLSDREIVHAKYRRLANGTNGGRVRVDPLERWLARDDLVVVKRIL